MQALRAESLKRGSDKVGDLQGVLCSFLFEANLKDSAGKSRKPNHTYWAHSR